MNTEVVAQEIQSLEARRYKAMIESDAETLERLLGDGLVYTHSTGTADDKSAYLQGVRSGKFTYRRIERRREQIQVYDETAIVTGESALHQHVGERSARLADGCFPGDLNSVRRSRQRRY